MFTNRRIRKHGLPAEATVKSMVPRRYGGAEMSRKYDYVLEVRPGDRAAFEAELTIVAGFLGAKPQEYDILKVKYDPKTLKVLFDYTGDARYETEAMNARTAQMRKETAELLAAKKAYLAGTTSAPEGNAIVAAERRINDFGDHGVLDAMRKVMLSGGSISSNRDRRSSEIPLFRVDKSIEHMYDVSVSSAATIELETALNEATGRLNLAHAELVAVIVKVLESGCWNGHGIRSPEHWVTWKTGVNPVRARDLVLVAKRSLELPVTSEAFNEGLLSVDQVVVISRDTPSEFDETVCTLARSATVPQLRSVLRKYPWSPCKPTKKSSDNIEPAPEPVPVDRVTARHDDNGRFHLHAEVGTLEGAEIEAALNEAKDALFRAGNRNATMADAFLEVCRRSLNAASSTSRTDNYRVYLHIDADRAWINGGPKLPESIRSKVLCDANIYPYLMSNGKPINVGRVTRVIPPHTRRAVLDRDSTCRYPGCTTRRLEVHHLVHWEHLGPTNTNNLAGLCSYHHDRHHDGTYTVSGNADIHDGLTFKRADGTTIHAGPQPTQPTGPLRAPPNPYKHPTGEQLQHKFVILSPNRKSTPNPNEQAAA